MAKTLLKSIFGVSVFLLTYFNAYSQCGPNTPTFVVDLTGNPAATWVSPSVVRDDNCCGTTAPDNCIKFIITLDPSAVGINFTISSGAVPPGALFYQINCGPPVAVGAPICLDGPGPHILTFCKPGNNQNTYSIESIPGAATSPDIVINDGCIGNLSVTGLEETSTTWTSIFPGNPGDYDSYLSCSAGCNNTTVTSQPGFPPFIDYIVCGTALAPCATGQICDTVRVTFNPTLFVNILPQDPTVCFGATTATFTATGTGGTPPYTFLWNTGATTASITTGVGTYSVLLSDASGCPPVSTTVTVTAFTNPITANAGTDISTCGTNPTVTLNGAVTGVTTGVWTGGNGTFVPDNTTLNATYTPTAAEIAAGSVTLTLSTTNNGTCPGDDDQVTITYTSFTTVLSTTTTPVSCNGGSNGTATVNTTGGFPPYTYSWNTTPIQTNQTATGLTAGTYTVTLVDVNGCIGSTNATVTEPFGLISNTTQDNVLCNGGSSGSAFVQVFGGTLPYSYLWSPSGITTPTANGLSNGTHIVTITDGNGCVHSDTVIISQPSPLVLNLTGTNVSCFGGSDGTATADISGGISPYTFSWTSSSTAQTATGLTAGSFSVTVTDDNGCTITDNISITEPPVLTVSVNATNVTCFGSDNGTGSAVVAGGTPGYTYTWLPATGTNSNINSLPPGNYVLTVTDLLGCTELAPFTIIEPNELLISIASQSNVNCFGGSDGSASVTVSGGTLGYTYSWSPNVSTTSLASNLTAGNYTATVTDANSCTANVPITITQPSAVLTGSEVVTDVTCNGGADGSITVTPAGGTGPYTYLWTFNGSTSNTITGLAANSYDYIITDANGCTFTNTVVVNEPLPLTLSTTPSPSTCGGANGSASVSASGGAGGYTYAWSPNVSSTSTASNILAGNYTIVVTDAAGCSGTTFVDVNDLTSAVATITTVNNVSCYGGSDASVTTNITSGFPSYSYLWTPSGSTDPNPTNLPAGLNTVQITDGNGCFSYFTVLITQPDSISLSMTMTPVSCLGGSDGTATVYASGGTPGYTYSWTPAAGTGSTGTGFSAGNVSVLVTDANGCTKPSSITITEPTQVTVAITGSSNVSCFGGSNGTATALGSNGTGPYTYLWMPGAISGPMATGLSTGTYTVTVTDANGCTNFTSVNITQPSAPLSVTFTSTPVSCFGGSNGTATAIPSGGTPGYFYNWTSGPQSTQTATGLSAGNQFVQVTDALGCSTIGFTNVIEPAALTASIITSNSTCGNANGNASVQVNGGNTPYTYLWTPGNLTTQVINNVPSGTYSVQVTDATGCITNATNDVINVPGPTISIVSTTDVSCFGGSNGSATATVASGTSPFQIVWLPSGGSSLTANNMPAGNYSVSVTDANGCQAFTTMIINEPSFLNPSILSVTNVSCNGFSDGEITSLTTGGAGGYSYSWSPLGGTGQNANNLPAGTYTLTATDINGCVSTATTVITEPPVLTLTVANQQDPNCFQGSDGFITVIAGGGTPAYSYSWNTTPVQNTVTASGLSMGTYDATVVDANGCVANISSSLGQPTQVTLSVSPNDTICGGQSTIISASSSGGSGPYIYVWEPNLGNNASYTVSPTVSTQYIVTSYDNFGCASSSTDTIDVQVYYLNSANFDVIGYSPICPGSASTVYASATGNTGPLSYVWNQGLGTGPGAFQVIPTTPTYYVCTVSNSCGLTLTDSVLIDFNPPPTVSFTSDVLSGCVPLEVLFNDFSITNTTDSIYSWYWDFGDGNSSSISNPVYVYNTVGTYNVTLTVATYGGCVGSSSANPYIIDVYPVPNASFTINQNTFNIPGEVLVCTNQSTGATGYNWSFGDGSTSTLTDPSYEYSTLGNFNVILIASNQYGCTDTASTTVTVTSDIVFPNAFTPNANGSNGGAYLPNDLTNDVFFPFTAGVDNFLMQIFNRWGELIFETHDINIGWDGYYRGELCEQGVYVWKAEVLFQDGTKYNKVGDVTLLR